MDDISLNISGIELARRFYEDCARGTFYSELGMYMDQMTVGLVGEGSECFGFDDVLSTDHDYGPSFCVWMSQDVYEQIGDFAQELYDDLPEEYMGVRFQLRRETASDRRGVLMTERFYQKFLGGKLLPENNMDWLKIPENYLAVCTNGELFHAPVTDFTAIRSYLLGFYPEDVRRKKLGANLVKMAHAGQVNFNRMATRDDPVACRLALDQFVEGAIKVLYLLDKKYCPYYKWMWRGLANVKDEYDIAAKLRVLALGDLGDYKAVSAKVEEIAALIIRLLHAQELSDSGEGYLERQAYSVIDPIEDAQLQRLPIMMG